MYLTIKRDGTLYIKSIATVAIFQCCLRLDEHVMARASAALQRFQSYSFAICRLQSGRWQPRINRQLCHEQFVNVDNGHWPGPDIETSCPILSLGKPNSRYRSLRFEKWKTALVGFCAANPAIDPRTHFQPVTKFGATDPAQRSPGQFPQSSVKRTKNTFNTAKQTASTW